MSSIENVIQRGKLLVHIAENGHSFELDCDEYTLVESVQQYLETPSGIRLNDQLLLYLDMKLEPQNPLSAYKLPSDEREIFVFNKSKMRSNSVPPGPEELESSENNYPDPQRPSSSSHDPHPLDEAPDPALKALPSYERQFRYHYQLGDAIYRRTLLKYETCERFAREQRVQEKALEIARGNLDHFYRLILQNYTDFVKCTLFSTAKITFESVTAIDYRRPAILMVLEWGRKVQRKLSGLYRPLYLEGSKRALKGIGRVTLLRGIDGELTLVGRLAAGACAGMTSPFVTYPLDVLRLRLAVDPGYQTMSDVFVKMLKEEGLGSFYRGLGPSLIGIAPYVAVNFCVFLFGDWR